MSTRTLLKILYRYRVSPTMMSCITEPHPGAYEGFSSQWLQANLISKGVYFESSGSSSRFRYHWYYTPQVCIK